MDIYQEILFPAAEEYNRTFSQGGQVQKSKDAPLSGQGGGLDSLELVNFIMVVEKKVQEATGKEMRLVTEEALSLDSSPFRNLASLEKFLSELLRGAASK